MMRIAFACAAASALALTACGSETSGEFTTEDGETGEYVIDNDGESASMTVETPDGTVRMRTGADTPTDLPAGFTLVSGANVLSNTIVDQGKTKGSLTNFQSDMAVDDILAHYRSEAENAGITIQIETNMNGVQLIGGENEQNGTTFSVSAFRNDEGASQVQLTISEEPG
jgi:hypothetical protein